MEIPIFHMFPLEGRITVQDPQIPPRLLRLPYHLEAFLLWYKLASLAAASGENASATSIKATRPLPRGKMLVFDRQDHESSVPAEKECSHSR